MERLRSYLKTLEDQYTELTKARGFDTAQERFILGKMAGVRTAIMLLQETDSTVPSKLVV